MSGLFADYETPAIERGWMWTLRGATLAHFLLLLGLAVATRLTSVNPLNSLLLPAAVYGWLLWALRENPPSKGALAAAVGMSAYPVGLAVLGIAMLGGGAAVGALFLGGVFLAHGTLGGAAIRVYYKLGRQDGDVRKLVAALFLAGLCWAIFASLIGDEVRRRHGRGRPFNEASAVGSLRTINTCEDSYASMYGKGYSPTLAALGSPPSGERPSAAHADLIDSVLASGQKSGYNFVYTASPPDKDGRILHYTVVAQPATPGVTGYRNFFADETGVIRATMEDRAANANDPPI